MLPESIILGILLVTLFAALALSLALGGTERPRGARRFDGSPAETPSSQGRPG